MSLSKLQSEVKKLLDDTLKLLSEAWDGEQAGAIYDQAETLAESAQANDSDDLGESLLGFGAYLSSFAYSTLVPRLPQVQQIRALAESVAEALQRSRAQVQVTDLSPEQTVMVPKRQEVIYIGDELPGIKSVQADFEAAGFSWNGIGRIEDFESSYDAEQARALIIKADLAGSWVRMQGKREQAVNLPQVAVATRDDLALRIHSIKAGADIYFVLPGEAQHVARRTRELMQDRDEPYRVMIIDDDPSMTLFCDSVLRHNGMRTHCINEPVNALSVLQDFEPDVILVDLYMPDISGLEMLALFRAHPKTLITPVILLSGDEDHERRFDTLLTGGDDYLTKPIRPRHLVAAVSARAKRARWLRRELRKHG